MSPSPNHESTEETSFIAGGTPIPCQSPPHAELNKRGLRCNEAATSASLAPDGLAWVSGNEQMLLPVSGQIVEHASNTDNSFSSSAGCFGEWHGLLDGVPASQEPQYAADIETTSERTNIVIHLDGSDLNSWPAVKHHEYTSSGTLSDPDTRAFTPGTSEDTLSSNGDEALQSVSGKSSYSRFYFDGQKFSEEGRESSRELSTMEPGPDTDDNRQQRPSDAAGLGVINKTERRRRRYGTAQAAEINAVRQISACIRCQMLKEQV